MYLSVEDSVAAHLYYFQLYYLYKESDLCIAQIEKHIVPSTPEMLLYLFKVIFLRADPEPNLF